MKQTKNNHFNGDHVGDPEIALYVDALLREELSSLPGEVLDHVEACPECKDKILDLFLFLKNPDASEAPPRGEIVEMPAKETTRFYRRKAAAAVFIFALMFAAYFLVFKSGFFTGTGLPGVKDGSVRQQVTQSRDDSGSETSAEEVDGKKVDGTARENRFRTPPNYRVNSNLEVMIGSQSRSADVQIISPRNNVYLKGDILFAWEETGLKPLHLKILDNRNEDLFEYKADGNRLEFKEKLRPGLYYWKLESKNDLLYVGKFFTK